MFEEKYPDDLETDLLLNLVTDSTTSLYNKVWEIPHERIFETGQIIDDAIAQLMIVKTKLDGRKQ